MHLTEEQIKNYTEMYPDVNISGLNPEEHWEILGSKIGRVLIGVKNNLNNCNIFNKKSEQVIVSNNSEKTIGIAVFIHLYYHDLWDEISELISNIPYNFDVYISLCDGNVNNNTIRSRIKEEYPSAFVFEFPNKGLDVAPFIELIKIAINNNKTYDYCLKIHTKKSLGSDPVVGKWWRKKTYDSLLGSIYIIKRIIERFINNPNVGMVGPAETRMSISQNDIQAGYNINDIHLSKLKTEFNVSDNSLDFFGGTMFWFRWNCISKYVKYSKLDISEYEYGYKVDGLLAHGGERLFGCMVRDSGFSLYEQSYLNDVLINKYNRKSICFIHPGFGIGGGNRGIFDIASNLSKHYNVYSVSFMGGEFKNWMNVKHDVIYLKSIDEARQFINLNKINIVFATGWQTYDFVKSLNNNILKAYLIQDYEPWFDNGEGAVNTYNNEFQCNFVNSLWLKNLLHEKHQLDSRFVKLGIDHTLSVKYKQRPENRKVVLCYHKLLNHKGRGADLIKEFLEKIPKSNDIILKVIGHEDPNVPEIEYLGELHDRELEELYSNTDIHIDLSRHRGHATMAMEMTKYGVVSILASPEYGLTEYGFQNRSNCLFVDGVDSAIAGVLELVNNKSLYRNLSTSSKLLSNQFSFDKTIKYIIPFIEQIGQSDASIE